MAPPPAFDLDAENECQQQFDAAHAAQFRQRKQRWCHRGGRMDDGRDMRVAKIHDVGGGRVHKGRAERIHALAAADHGRLVAARKFSERFSRDLHRMGAAARERNGKEIQQCTLGLMARGLGHVLPTGLDGKASQRLRDGGCLQHGSFQRFYRSKLLRRSARVPDAVQREALVERCTADPGPPEPRSL
jgi:hypothetical protein